MDALEPKAGVIWILEEQLVGFSGLLLDLLGELPKGLAETPGGARLHSPLGLRSSVFPSESSLECFVCECSQLILRSGKRPGPAAIGLQLGQDPLGKLSLLLLGELGGLVKRLLKQPSYHFPQPYTWILHRLAGDGYCACATSIRERGLANGLELSGAANLPRT